MDVTLEQVEPIRRDRARTMLCLVASAAVHAAVLATTSGFSPRDLAFEPARLEVVVMLPRPVEVAPPAPPEPLPVAEPVPAIKKASPEPKPMRAQKVDAPRPIAPTPAQADPEPSRVEPIVQPQAAPLVPDPVPAPAMAPAAALAPPAPPDPVPAPRASPDESMSREQAARLDTKVPPSASAAYLHNPKPGYPRSAQRRGEQGTVHVRVVVSRDGKPLEVTLAKTSGSSALDEAALDAVRAWRFTPARRGAEPIQDVVTIPVVFKLEDGG